ncbi:MAG: protein kinase [bacterium]|nr:protein kinase [bacterium]
MQDPSRDSGESRVEQLLADVVARPIDRQQEALEELILEHPTLAQRLREQFEMFRHLEQLNPRLAADQPPPERVGEYELVRELGRGGMGIVYLARQQRADQERLVALKLVRDRGLFSFEARERLRREGAAAFQLDHPGICQVLDTGEVEGTPYLAMRYVPGATLSAYIATAVTAEQPLALPRPSAADSGSTTTGNRASNVPTVHATIALIEQVARALHAAHEAGFVHRDVKPGNIMVTPDGAPVLLDFGLVRDQSSTAGLTQSGQPIGTPAYMSPEQIESRDQGIDRATDIYSLGATLYEALTLRQPFFGATREALFHAILNSRPVDMARIVPAIERDLGTVVATAMNRDADRRYRTALDFAEDLHRVRHAQPILAQPPSLGRRLQLWSRRNPLAAVILAMLAIALAANIYLAISARLRADEAREAQQRAQADFAAAREAVGELALLARTHLSDVPQLEEVRRQLFERAMQFHRRFLERTGPTPELRLDRAITQVKYAELSAHLGDLQTAGDLLARATSSLEELGDNDDPTALWWLSQAQSANARLAEDRGEHSPSEAAYRAAISTLERLANVRALTPAETTTLARAHRNLAMGLESNERLAEAEELVRTGLDALAATEDPRTSIERAKLLGVRARLLRSARDLEGADRDWRDAAQLLREVLRTKPHDRDAMTALASNLGTHAVLLARGDDEAATLAAYTESRELLEKLTAAFPLARINHLNLAITLKNQARLLIRRGEREAAIEGLERARELTERFVAEDPASAVAQRTLAFVRTTLGNTVRGAEPERAIQLYSAALASLQRLLQNDSQDRVLHDSCWRAANSLGAVLANHSRDTEALAAFATARRHGGVLLEQSPDNLQWQRNQSILLHNLGSLACEMGQLELAEDRLREALELDASFTARAPKYLKGHANHREHQLRLGQIVMLRDPARALKQWRQAAATLTDLPAGLRARVDAMPGSRLVAGSIERGLAESLIATADHAAAIAALDRASTYLTEEQPSLATSVERLLLHATRAQARHRMDDQAGAETALNRALTDVAPLVAVVRRSRLHCARLRRALVWMRELAQQLQATDAEPALDQLAEAVALR